MKSNHTTGKWIAVDHKEQDKPRKAYFVLQDQIRQAKNIATVHPDVDMTPAEVSANAKLIAAAPDMFRLLSDIEVRLGDLQHERELYTHEKIILELIQDQLKQITL